MRRDWPLQPLFREPCPIIVSVPDTPTYSHDVTIYHAQPHGNRTPMGEPVVPTHFVDVSSLIARKGELLLAHASQGAWLDETQQISSYVNTLENLNREVGSWSQRFEFAEGWRKHLHLGLCAETADPLAEALTNNCIVN